MNYRLIFLLGIAAFVSTISAQSFDSHPAFEENYSEKKLNEHVWGVDIAEFKGHNVFFTDRNYSIKKGILYIKLKKQKYKKCSFTSSSIWTKSNSITFGYGKLMIRARIPATKECRPAMWLKAKSSDNGISGEIDLLEHWPTQDGFTYQTNFHLWGRLTNTALGSHQQYPKIVKKHDLTQWHIYSVEILKNKIAMKVDDVLVAQWGKDELPDWPSNIKYQLYLSLACSTWSTEHVKESKNLPQTMQIDWVKFYKLKN